MVNARITAVAVALALLASVKNAVCQTTGTCDTAGSTRCYWERAHKYGVKVLVPVPGNKTEYLKNVCASETEMPVEPKCKHYYAGCSESEKLKFENPEKGYSQLQMAVTDAKKCKGVRNLTKCIDMDVLMNCPVHFSTIPVPSNADRNHQSAVNLTLCLEEALKSCNPTELPNCMKHIRAIAGALPLMYWYEEHKTTTTELPSSTSVSTDPTHETSPTTEKTVPTSEQTTEPTQPSETTTVHPETTTNQPSSSEPATTNPTETPTPATTPKPSGAATSVPFVGSMMFISAFWLALAA